MTNKAIIKELRIIDESIECNGFFACPGYKKRFKHMATCSPCYAKQRINRLIKKLENYGG